MVKQYSTVEFVNLNCIFTKTELAKILSWHQQLRSNKLNINCLSIKEIRKKSLQLTIRSIYSVFIIILLITYYLFILFTDHQGQMQHCTTRKNNFF